MSRMVKISIILLLFLSVSLFSQNQPILISGYVIDSIINEKKSNINIVSATSNIGIVSDKNGFFKIQLSDFPDTLNFSYVGYYTKEIYLSNDTDTNFIVELVPKVYKLNEVAIFSDNDTYNTHINKFSILDYGFIGDSILILQKKRSFGGVPSLVLLNRDYDTIAFNNNLPKDSKQLFKDCMGYYHLLSKDSAYQVVLELNTLGLMAPFDKDWFNQILGDCKFKKGEDLFFELPIYNGFGHEIIYVNEENERKLFVKYADTKQLMNLRENITGVSESFPLHIEVSASTNNEFINKDSRHFEFAVRYLTDFENKPIKNNICLFQDIIFYFNFYESKIQCFSDVRNPPSEFDLNSDNTKGWKGEIIIDQIENKVYSIEKNKAFYDVYLVDIEEGEFDYCTRISQFKGEKLSVNNGFVYYLTKPSLSRNSIAKLSRIKLRD